LKTQVRVPFARERSAGADVAPPGGGAEFGIAPPARRRSLVRAAAGAAVVVVSAGVFTAVAASAGHRVQVLALARPVPLGHLLTPRDVKVVELSASSQVPMLPAADRDGLLGRTLRQALPAGTLLAPRMLGAPALPAGQGQVSLLVKEGHYPPDLAPGQQVAILDAGTAGTGSSPSEPSSAPSSSGGGGDQAGAVHGTVLEVRPATDLADGSGGAVVTVTTSSSDAERAAAFADPAVVVIAPSAADGR
jgi:hypothetical protein